VDFLNFNPALIEDSPSDTSGAGELVNVDNTITGDGTISAALTNYGIVNAATWTLTVSGSTTNNGLMQASKGGTLSFASGALTNLSGSVLTGGTYEADANSTISLPGSITTNAATVILNGPGSTFSAINSLANNEGSFSVLNGQTFTTAGSLANSGTLAVGASGNGATLIVSGSLMNTGTINVTDSTFTVSGTFANDGKFTQDPSTVEFGGLVLGGSSYSASPGDTIRLDGNLSTTGSGALFSIAGATVELSDTSHVLSLDENLIVSNLQLDSGATVNLEGSNGATLYVDDLTLGTGDTLDSFSGSGVTIDYNPADSPGLSGIYTEGGVTLQPGTAPVPEPGEVTLAASAATLLLLFGGKRYRRTSM